MTRSTTLLFDAEEWGEVADVETAREAVALFEKVGMPARNLAGETRRAYLRDLQGLADFLEERKIKRLADVSLRDLEAYLAKLDSEGYAPSTRRRQTHTIKSFFRFLHDHGVVRENVTLRLVAPRAGKREPRFLSEREYKRLLRACSHHPRDAAIIEVFLQTGMRLSELSRLTLDDVELPARVTQELDNLGVATVTRKGGSRDTIPLNYKACRALKMWIQARPVVEHDALFVTKFRTAMKPRAIQAMGSKYLKEAEIKGASVHTLRHTMATHHIARGTDLKTVQETLGHADLTTTAMYVQLAKRAQKKALQEHAL